MFKRFTTKAGKTLDIKRRGDKAFRLYKFPPENDIQGAYHSSQGFFRKIEPQLNKPLLTDKRIAEPMHQEMEPFLNPRQIRGALDEYIVGQDQLKRTMSVAIYNHYKRLEYNQREDAQELVVEKSNILLFGPTGSGKTLIVKTIAQMLDVPFSINDASPFTQTGYVGDDVDMCIHRLLQNADYDVQRAERGIVFIDEVDKLARRSDLTNPNQRDVSGEGVQQGLLRMLEGTTIAVNPKSPSRGGFVPSAGQSISVDTTNILFICSGAFVGLDKVILDRVQTKSQIGFKSQTETQQELVASNPLDLAEPEDVIRYGFIPELVGRLPCFAAASQLTKEQLCQILTEPKNSIVKQYQQLFLCSNLELLFHPEALVAIAEIASTKNTGARGLRRIMENVLRDALYELPGTTIKYVVVTKEAVLGAKVLAFQPHEQREAYMAAE